MEKTKPTLNRRVSFSNKSDIRYFDDSVEESVQMDVSSQDIIQIHDINKSVRISESFSLDCSNDSNQKVSNVHPNNKSSIQSQDFFDFSCNEDVENYPPLCKSVIRIKRRPVKAPYAVTDDIESNLDIFRKLPSHFQPIDNELDKTYLNTDNEFTHLFKIAFDKTVFFWTLKAVELTRYQTLRLFKHDMAQYSYHKTCFDNFLAQLKNTRAKAIEVYKNEIKQIVDFVKIVRMNKETFDRKHYENENEILKRHLDLQTFLEEQRLDTKVMKNNYEKLKKEVDSIRIEKLQGFLIESKDAADVNKISVYDHFIMAKSDSFTNEIYLPNTSDDVTLTKFFEEYIKIRIEDAYPDNNLIKDIYILNDLVIVRVQTLLKGSLDRVLSVDRNPNITFYDTTIVDRAIAILKNAFTICKMNDFNKLNSLYTFEEFAHITDHALNPLRNLLFQIHAIINTGKIHGLRIQTNQFQPDPEWETMIFTSLIRLSLKQMNKISIHVFMPLRYKMIIRIVMIPSTDHVTDVSADFFDSVLLENETEKCYKKDLNAFITKIFSPDAKPVHYIRKIAQFE